MSDILSRAGKARDDNPSAELDQPGPEFDGEGHTGAAGTGSSGAARTAGTGSPGLGGSTAPQGLPQVVPRRDFVEGIKGVHVSDAAPIITWANGSTTVAPYLAGDSLTTNDLAQDEACVKLLAKSPFASPQSPADGVHFITSETVVSKGAFLTDVRSALAKGQIVVLPRHDPSLKMDFTMEAMEEEFGYSPKMNVVAHGKPLSLLPSPS